MNVGDKGPRRHYLSAQTAAMMMHACKEDVVVCLLLFMTIHCGGQGRVHVLRMGPNAWFDLPILWLHFAVHLCEGLL